MGLIHMQCPPNDLPVSTRHGSALAAMVLVLALAGCQEPPDGEAINKHPSDATTTAGQRPPGAKAPLPAFVPPPEAIGINNRAVGHMGRFEYAKAHGLFAQLVARYPRWTAAKVNLAIATLNRQHEGDEAAALALVDEVLAGEPNQLRAHYVAGILRLYLASPEAAIGHFAKVADGDPDDAYAAYYLGQCLAQTSAPERALESYRRALTLDPYLRSAAYGAFQALQRLQRRDEARAFIAAYQHLATNPRARLAEFKYTRMGAKAEVVALGAAPDTPPIPRPQGPLFADRVSTPLAGAGELAENGNRPVSLTAVDLESDGGPLLFVAGMGEAGQGNRLLRQGPAGGFEALPDHPLARVPQVNAALWGDFDNDGLTDVYLCRRGENQLWRNEGAGNWRDVTATTGTGNGNGNGRFDTVDGAFFDADHDGDLDIFLVNGDGPNGFLYNNRDGTFRAGQINDTEEANRTRASRMILPADLDRDRDADLIVLNGAPPHEVYINDRLWAYHSAPGFAAFAKSPALAAVAGDVDADGRPEIYTLTPSGELIRWSRSSGQEGFVPALMGTPVRGFSPPADGDGDGQAGKDLPWAQLALLDADGDGVLELLLATPDGWGVVRVGEDAAGKPVADSLFTARIPNHGLRGITPLLSEPGKGFGVVGVLAGKDAGTGAGADSAQLAHWPPGAGRYPFVSLRFSGREDVGNALRSNASGIGTRMAARAGARWTIAENFRDHTGPGQGLQPVAIGLGGEEKLDFVSLDWSDGVLQTELDLAPGRRHRITETQRQLSSCPVLFAWDGQRYAFVTDFLGVGGIGYALGPGEYNVPRPWENLLLPSGVRPKDGKYAIKLTEPMEEVAYIDALGLVAYDVPPGWRIALDERMNVEGPAPTGAALFYRRELLPRKVVNDRGETVTDTVLRVDGQAAPVGEWDRRFIGRLAGEHVLTLDFGRDITGQEAADRHGGAAGGEPVLVMDGWVEYPYSQTMFAAWQAGASWEAPTVEALGKDGNWQPVLNRFGYPAGMPRRMSVPLAGLPPGASRLRLRTNQEIYWDRIAVAFPEPVPGMRRQKLPMVAARLAITGFPKRIDHPQHRPGFDYGRRRPFWDTRPMAGLYTKPGPVRALLTEGDDALAIFGAGEEIHVEFETPVAPPPPGWRRYLVLETRGWTKDRDLFTKEGDTVGPLPGSGQDGGRDSERRAALHAGYNTRLVPE
uniref:Repeat domain-containing protein n=1 Tax=Candidatus Kentrum sp. DK TaxID=2126562 RepID=A0A450S828_9GAMM|nr:MAG: Repeat domain-containing protein [Candidatus Kentron sp. DK]